MKDPFQMKQLRYVINGTCVSLTARFQLSRPKQQEYAAGESSPLELHGKNSRFELCLEEKKGEVKKSLNANIPARSIQYISKKIEMGMQKIMDHQLCAAPEVMVGMNVPDGSLAATRRFQFGKNKGRTPLDLLQDPNGEQELKREYSFYQQNVKQFPSNKTILAAIEEALRLRSQAEGHVDMHVSTGPIVLYDSGLQYMVGGAKVGSRIIYQITISVTPSNKYPFELRIMNCGAPEGMKDGKVRMRYADLAGKQSLSFYLSEECMADLIYQMKSEANHFEAPTFRQAYKEAFEKIA